MRAQGSLRVILNTKIWAGQTVERAAAKSVKISAWDIEENAVKIFLIQVRAKPSKFFLKILGFYKRIVC